MSKRENHKMKMEIHNNISRLKSNQELMEYLQPSIVMKGTNMKLMNLMIINPIQIIKPTQEGLMKILSQDHCLIAILNQSELIKKIR